jgi:hypothetical protein
VRSIFANLLVGLIYGAIDGIVITFLIRINASDQVRWFVRPSVCSFIFCIRAAGLSTHSDRSHCSLLAAARHAQSKSKRSICG